MALPRILSALTLAVLLAGCAGSGGEQAVRPQPNVITEDEIQPAQFRSAFELIRAVRPQWLATSGTSIGSRGAGLVVVYVDGMRMGGPENLRQIPTTDMVGARFLPPTEATTRHGTGHTGGAIEIRTRR